MIDLIDPHVVDLTSPTGSISPLSTSTTPSMASITEGSSGFSPISGDQSSVALAIAQPFERSAHQFSVVSQHGPSRLLTTSVNHRQTTKSAHHQRQDGQEYKDIHKCALKLGTVLWDGVKTKAKHLKHLADADACATAINKLMQVELVSEGPANLDEQEESEDNADDTPASGTEAKPHAGGDSQDKSSDEGKKIKAAKSDDQSRESDEDSNEVEIVDPIQADNGSAPEA